MIEAQLVSRRWFRLLPGVHATFTVPSEASTPISALWWAAHLYSGEESVLCGRSALQAVALCEPGPPVHIAVPWTRRTTKVADWLVVQRHRHRRSRRIRPDLPPFIRPADALVDVAGELSSRTEVIDIVSKAFGRYKVSPERLAEVLRERKVVRHRMLLTELVAEARRGETTPLESAGTRRILRAHGLPVGRGQVREGQNGAVVIRDRVIIEFGLVIEFDGHLGHADARGRFRDHRRDNAVTLSGRAVLRFGWVDVHEEACESALQVAKVLADRGWSGDPEPCGPGCRAIAGCWVRLSG